MLNQLFILKKKRETRVINNSHNPVWNEELKFYLHFPSLVKQIKFELCNQESNKIKVLAVEYLDIDSIYRNKDILPLFRKSHIDMYSVPADKSYSKRLFNINPLIEQFELKNNPSGSIHRDINFERDSTHAVAVNENEIGIYVARVLLDIKSSDLNKFDVVKENAHNPKTLENNLQGRGVSDFVAYAILSDVTKINKKYKNDLSFRLCVGK